MLIFLVFPIFHPSTIPLFQVLRTLEGGTSPDKTAPTAPQCTLSPYNFIPNSQPNPYLCSTKNPENGQKKKTAAFY